MSVSPHEKWRLENTNWTSSQLSWGQKQFFSCFKISCGHMEMVFFPPKAPVISSWRQNSKHTWECVDHSVMSNCHPMVCSPPGSSVHGILQVRILAWVVIPTRFLCTWNSPGKNTGLGSHSLLQGDLPNPGIKPGSPTSQADILSSELLGKPKF